MRMQKWKSRFISTVVQMAMLAVLLTPATTALAESGTEEEITSYSTEDGLVARWTFDGNYTESVSNLNTQLGAKNLTYVEGVHGKAAVFNGKDNYLYVEGDPILNLGNSGEENNDNFTISAWVNLRNAKEGYQYLLDKGKDIGWDKNDGCYWTNPYRLRFDISEPELDLSNAFEDSNAGLTTEGSALTGGKYVEGEEWFLLTATYDGSRVKIYHDNELLTQSNYTDGITYNEDELFIGVDCKLENYFRGAVDDLRLYTKTLSYDDVNALYQEGVKSNKEFVEPTKQLVAYYSFDGDLKDASSYKNNAKQIAVGGTTKYIPGMNGNAITMSRGNYIQVPAADQLNLETEFTVSCWVKVDAEGDYPILYRENPSNSDDNENDWTYRLSVNSWSNGENTDFIMNTTAYNPDNWVPEQGQNLSTQFTYDDTKLKSTNWLHYTCTYKDGQMISYINGKQFEKSEKSDFINLSNASGDLLIGYDGSTFIKGALDELKIYSSCLSPTEVAKEADRVDSISLSNDTIKSLAAIGKGKSVAIKKVLRYDVDADKTVDINTSDKNITMSSSNKKVFTVTNDGSLKAVKAGKAKLTVTHGGCSVTYNVVVK